MEKKAVRHSVPGLLAAFCAFALAATLCALAHPAKAMADGPIAHAEYPDGKTAEDFYSIDDVEKAMYQYAVIIMDADWDLESASLNINDAKDVTINMNGWKITSSNKDATIYLNENASLTLKGPEEPVKFTYRGYAQKDTGWQWQDMDISTGGLVTNERENEKDDVPCGIHMEDNAQLELDNVAVAGCPERGINANSNCDLTLNNAQVCYNRTPGLGVPSRGAGVHLGSESVLTMTASHIDNNYAQTEAGGGVFAEEKVDIYLEKGSTISNNFAGAGGGVYFNGTYCTLQSKDMTGAVSGNTAWESYEGGTDASKSGGGVHVDKASGDNKSTIDGIAFKDNFSRYDGGAIELDQRWTAVRNCTFTGNHSDYDGGAIYVNGENNSIEDCTVRDNYCNGIGQNQEGGGIFVSCHYDVNMEGKCVVKGNTRGKGTGNADDVFLSTLSGGGAKAYITGELDSGSSVGIRTGIEEDRRVASGFKCDTKDCLFIDMDGYYVSYGTDDGGDAWQRHTTKEFSVKAAGQDAGTYRNGTSVTVSAPAAPEGKAFWFWSSNSEGLRPVDDYINDSTKYASALSFKMPQNDVDLGVVYADIVDSAEISGFKAPAAGEDLPATAVLDRADGKDSGANGVPARITWYKVTDGKRAAVTGKAEAGAEYAAVFTVPQSSARGCFFSTAMGAGDVSVTVGGAKVSSAKVDASTGTLTVEATGLKAAGDSSKTTTGRVTVKCKGKGLTDGGSSASLLSAAEGGSDGQPVSEEGVLHQEELTYTYESEDDMVAVTAPHVPNWNFCDWQDPQPGWEQDDVDGVIRIPASDLNKIDALEAYYTPVVTGLEVSLDAPVGGKDLATKAAEVKGKCSDGSEVDFAEEAGVDGFKVTWSPESEDGTAGYSTTYTALVELYDAAGGVTAAEDVLKRGAKVTCNGVEATSAGFVVVGDKLCLALAFPATDAVKATGIAQPGDVELTFEQAAGYAAEQERHAGTLCWPLPKTVDVKLQNGKTVDGEIAWDIPEGFDPNATTAQEIAVKGKVRIASEDEVDTSGISLDVSTTIKIAAPSQGGGEDDGGTPVVEPEGEGGDGNGTADAKSTSAKTGDAVPASAAAGAAIAAIAAAAAGASALRRRKN